MRSTATTFGLGLLAAVATTGIAAAGPVLTVFEQPTLDRWMYPFNATPGIRPEASIFASVNMEGFDDRDAQFLIGFDTGAIAPPGQSPESYIIKSVTLRVTISQGGRFVYDPTFDAVATSYDPNDPEYVPDADPGKPIEVFGCGYRNGYGALTTPTTTEFCEICPFGGMPTVPPAEGARNVFAANFNTQGVATDVSSHVRERFEAVPFAIGTTAAVQPGEIVPADTEFVFELSACDPETRAYLQRSLSEGRLNLMVTSLHAIPGPGATTYPVFYTRENPLAALFGYEPKLEVIVNTGLRADADNNGLLNVDDFVAFSQLFAARHPGADMDDNCLLNVDDFVAFSQFFAGGR